MGQSTAWLLLAMSVLAAVSLFLLVRSVRGRRIGDEPHCRRCGFDLRGRPATSVRCSECGADLTLPKAFTYGTRGRHPWRATVAALVLIACVATAFYASPVIQYTQSVRVYPRLPLWFLLYESTWDSTARRAEAIDEIKFRLLQRRVNDAQIDSILEHALRVQSDRSLPWDRFWGELLDEQLNAGTLSPARMARYGGHALPLAQLVTRQSIEQGEDLPIQVRYTDQRLGGNAPFYVHLERSSEWKLDHKPMWRRQQGQGAFGPVARYGASPPALFTFAQEQMPPSVGWHLLSGRLRMRVYQDKNRSALLEDVDLELSCWFEVVPRGQWSVKKITNPAELSKVQSAVRRPELRDNPNGFYFLETTLFFDKPVSIGLGYNVYARVGGQEWRVGSFYREPDAEKHHLDFYYFGSKTKGFPPGTTQVDLVLRASPDAVRASTKRFDILDGDWVITGVPVEHVKD